MFNPQTAALNRTGKLLGFTPCPHCKGYGCLYEAWDPAAQGTGWIKWCYKCGHREACERRIDKDIREQRIRDNNRRIRQLEAMIQADRDRVSRSGQAIAEFFQPTTRESQ